MRDSGRGTFLMANIGRYTEIWGDMGRYWGGLGHLLDGGLPALAQELVEARAVLVLDVLEVLEAEGARDLEVEEGEARELQALVPRAHEGLDHFGQHEGRDREEGGLRRVWVRVWVRVWGRVWVRVWVRVWDRVTRLGRG